MNFEGKVAVITGAGGGIGRGLALEAGRRRMRVVLADVNAAALAYVAEELRATAMSVVTQVTDVSDAAAVDRLADVVFDTCGGVHALFNNAGVYVDGTAWRHSEARWRWLLDINVMGVVHGINAFLPRMIRANSQAVVANTASIAGLMSFPHVGCYSASKHAIVALTESLHYELQAAKSEVRAALVCPGAVATGIATSAQTNPARVGDGAAHEPAAHEFHTRFSEIVAQGMTPEAHGRFVFDELHEGKFWIISDRSFLPMIEERTRSIQDHRAPRFGS